MSPARTDVTTQITERVLIDRPVEVVWKLACDVVGALQAIPNVRLGEHSPLGDRASFDAIISRPPYRVHLQATAAMIESDAMERTVRIAIVGRDRSGRGQLHATLAIRVSEFGAGAQLITDLEIRCAGALVRAIGDAAFDGLQTVLHEWIVACTGDAFASLPEAPSLWDDFEVESVPESATSVFDSQAGKLVACESVASVSLASASVSGASVSGASVSGASV
ncbi:MAG: hypothetical protein ACOYN3_09800, partial [Acidimicrobiia bacterium]